MAVVLDKTINAYRMRSTLPWSAMMVDKKFEHRPPSHQTAFDIFEGHWASDLADVLPGVRTGVVNVFAPADVRPRFAVEQFGQDGSLAGMRILELGPLEAGHTYQLEKFGAQDILAVEANSEAFLKCLIVKEAVGLKARFIFGNVIEYLKSIAVDGGTRYDLVFCSGILYHMTDPLALIKLISKVTDKCFVWSHYHRDGLSDRRPVAHSLDGFDTTYWFAEYGGIIQTGEFSGGIAPSAAWLSRDDILAAFRHFGFDQVDVLLESVDGPVPPHFSVSARRTTA